MRKSFSYLALLLAVSAQGQHMPFPIDGDTALLDPEGLERKPEPGGIKTVRTVPRRPSSWKARKRRQRRGRW